MTELLHVSLHFAKENWPPALPYSWHTILQCPFYRVPELDSCHETAFCAKHLSCWGTRHQRHSIPHGMNHFCASTSLPLAVLSFAPGAQRARYRPVLAVGRSVRGCRQIAKWPQGEKATTMSQHSTALSEKTSDSDGTFFANWYFTKTCERRTGTGNKTGKSVSI